MVKYSLEWVECKSCEKKFTLKEPLQCHVIEVHGKHWKHFREALEDQVEGCYGEQVKPEPEEFEEHEFNEDKKALNDQGEGEGTNSFLSSLNSSSSNPSGSFLTFSSSQAFDFST